MKFSMFLAFSALALLLCVVFVAEHRALDRLAATAVRHEHLAAVERPDNERV